MPIVRIEHNVASYEAWKRNFDSDPVDRAGSGVRRYIVMRSLEDPKRVMIDLEFDTLIAATDFVAKIRKLWSGPAKGLLKDPNVRIVESIEVREVESRAGPLAEAH